MDILAQYREIICIFAAEIVTARIIMLKKHITF
jgi:hypothetical protein